MWDVIKDWVFDVIQFFYNGVGDWGMAIIIITIIFRIIVAPLVHKSTTANFAMQKVQPLLQEIQTKFADDPVRQREEMQRLQQQRMNCLIPQQELCMQLLRGSLSS